jgi:hypothetical protein
VRDEFETTNGNLEYKYLVEIDLTVIRNSLFDILDQAYENPRWRPSLLKEPLQWLNSDEFQDLFAPIAEKGATVYHAIFESKDIEPQSHKNDTEGIVREAVLSALARVGIISIVWKKLDAVGKLKSAKPLFPWAFLYADTTFRKTNPETLNLKYFLGFMYEIQEIFPFTSNRRRLPARPKMVAAICPDEDEKRHDASDHPFAMHGQRIEMTRTPTTDELGNALKRFAGDCLYFYGHVFHPDPPERTESYLKLKDDELTVDWLARHYQAPQFDGEPILAFLNGCKTARLKKWDKESVLGFFCHRGEPKLCCIATVAEVPRLFAFEFGKHFWGDVLTEQYIGRALLNARREMLHEYNNPLGLLYSLFGCVDTHLMPQRN